MSDATRKAFTDILIVAAELATGKWLLSEYRDDHRVRVPKATMTAINVQNEHARLAAIRLRKAHDALARALPSRAITSPLIDRLVTVENDPTVPTYARKVAADAVRAMGGANADPT